MQKSANEEPSGSFLSYNIIYISVLICLCGAEQTSVNTYHRLGAMLRGVDRHNAGTREKQRGTQSNLSQNHKVKSAQATMLQLVDNCSNSLIIYKLLWIFKFGRMRRHNVKAGSMSLSHLILKA